MITLSEKEMEVPMRDRKVSREALMKRLQEGQQRQANKGGLFKAGVDIKMLSLATDQSHTMDIIPYWAGRNDPWVSEGEENYVLKIPVHRDVGMNEGMILCRAEFYPAGSLHGPARCPICEDRKRKQREGAPDNLIKALTPGRYPRELYNAICYDSREEERKGIQLFHTSEYLFGIYLAEIMNKPVRPNSDNLETLIPFMDLKTGKQIVFKKTGKQTDTKFIGIRFVDRDYELDDVLSDRAYCLDEIIRIPTEKEVEEYYFGPEGTEKEEYKGKRTEVRDHMHDEEEPVRRPKKEVEEEEPVRRRRPAEEEEEPKKKDKCPDGYEFGVDTDTKKACKKCDEWEECTKVNAHREAESRSKKEDPEEPVRRRRTVEEDEPPPKKKTEEEEEPVRRRRPAETESEDDPPPRRRRVAEDVEPQEDEPPRRRRRVAEDD